MCFIDCEGQIHEEVGSVCVWGGGGGTELYLMLHWGVGGLYLTLHWGDGGGGGGGGLYLTLCCSSPPE